VTVPSTSATPPSPAAHAPLWFGKYLLVRKLAQGGMAEIYLAKHLGAEGFERNVVIKCMLGHLTQNQDFVSMFLDEARLAARLHHPNIVQITELGEAEGRYFICMEYLPGEDLETLLGYARHRGQLLPIPIVARIMLSALEALEFAHGYQEQGQPLGLVHRDISPSNIFVTFQGMVKLLDFGIAKAAARLTHTEPGTLKGKLGYMSPEQAQSDEIDARSDLFSLGVTFHELLTGRRVFEFKDEVRVLMALMNQPVEPPSLRRLEIPPALDRIVLKAVERQREKRYASAAAMRADLEEFLKSMPMAPGMSQLAQYVQGLVGSAVVERKTKVPTLSELREQGAVPLEDELGSARTLVRPASQGDFPLSGVHTLEDSGAPRTGQMFVTPAPARSATGQSEVLLHAVRGPDDLEAPRTEKMLEEPAPRRSTGRSLLSRPQTAVALLALGALGAGGAWYLQLPMAPPTPPVVAAKTPEPAPKPKAALPAQPAEQPARAAAPTRRQPVRQRATPAPTSSDTDYVGKVIDKHESELLACGAQHPIAPNTTLRLKAKILLKPSGELDNVKISSSDSLPPDLVVCIQSRIESITFPPNPDGAPVLYTLSLHFTGAAP
jgi:serine/threonine protein kinase